jgi:predicted permease
VGRLAPKGRESDLIGDLEEAHRRRAARRGDVVASILSGLEALDVARALTWERARCNGVPVSLLDFKLGIRMLRRYPGLTSIGAFALAFGVCAASVAFDAVAKLVGTSIPIEDGEAVIGVVAIDIRAGERAGTRTYDYSVWRDELTSVQELGAFRDIRRNLGVGGRTPEPVTVTEITGSALAIARVAPLLGRLLVPADESPSAPAVTLLGYEAWQRHLEGDPGVVGRTVSLGGAPTVVVGVMPEGFGFPVRGEVWTPLRSGASAEEPGVGPALGVIGRLRPGASRDDAQAQVTTIGARLSRDHPSTHGHLRFEVRPYRRAVTEAPDLSSPEFWSFQVWFIALVVLLSANVALLIFARAAARERELVVRSALGAGRARIVGQLLAEALVLGALAAIAGIFAANLVVDSALNVVVASEGPLPFWVRRGLEPSTTVYAIAVALVAAGVAGLLPGLKATRGLASALKDGTTGGGMRFGGVWTIVIVAQVAVTVWFPAMTLGLSQEASLVRTLGVPIATDEYVAVSLDMDDQGRRASSADTSTTSVRLGYESIIREIERRLESETAVVGVTFASSLPRDAHRWGPVEVDAGPRAGVQPLDRVAGRATIDPDFFEVLGAPVLAGRSFDARDLDAAARTVIVNEPFVEEVLSGGNAIGRRVRYPQQTGDGQVLGDWYEVVGVVPDLGMGDTRRWGVYHAAVGGHARPVWLLVHVRGDVDAFLTRLRSIAAEVDPSLRLERSTTLEGVVAEDVQVYGFGIRVSIVMSAMALVLSLMGVYATVSFIVSRRTREIGVRVALGADRSDILRGILRRPLAEVALGVVLGALFLAWTIHWGIFLVEGLGAREVALIAMYALAMECVCATACVVPGRRALGISPSRALSADC